MGCLTGSCKNMGIVEMLAVLHLDFIRYAIAAGVLAAVACGVIGPLVVVNRLVFLSGGVAHAAYGGIGLALFLGLCPTLGAMGFSVVIALLMGLITIRDRERSDTVIGVMWAMGMALGVILVDLTPGYNVDLMSYLFGSILVVPGSDLVWMVLLDVVVVAVVGLFYREFLAVSYDQEFAVTVGVPVRLLYFLLIVLVAMTVVMLIRVVGLLLVIALLTIPAYIAERHTRSLAKMMAGAVCYSLLFTLSGLAASFEFNLSSGASIIMIAGIGFFIAASRPDGRGRRERRS